MINVSENLKSLISEDSRTFRVRLITDGNTYENIRSFKKNIMFPSSSMSIGNALSACIQCTATDIPVSITGKKIEAEITILGSEEQIVLGSFKAEKPTVKDGDVTFVAYDAMKTAAEKTYKSTLDEGGHTAQEYFTDICAVLGEECKALDEADGTLIITEDKLSGYSCRDALAYLAGYLGKNCIVNRDGLFEMVGFAAVEYDLFNEDRIAEPEFADSFCCLGYINCCIDNETTLQSGTGSNGFEFISPIMTQERLDAVGETVFGENSVIKEYKPCKVVQLLGDPSIEVCDVLDLSYGGEVYKIPVMAVTLEYDGGLMVTAESYAPTEPQSTSLGERMTFAQKQAQKENDAHISGIVEFSQLIQSAYGVKSTTIDGITYFHDMETLAESTFIFCITSEGFAQASGANCWGGSHKDTVWKYGLSKDGTAVIDMLNVFKITASLIRAGRLESNDGSAYFDLDEGVIGVNKVDEDSRSDLYSSLFSYYGLDMDISNINFDFRVELTEKEENFIKNAVIKLGYSEGTILYTVYYRLLAAGLKMTKAAIGVNITGKNTEGTKFKSHHGADKFFISRETYDETGEIEEITTTTYGVDGIESDSKQTFKAPELYFEGNILPCVLPKTNEDGSKVNFDDYKKISRFVSEITLGDGETSNYENSPSAAKAHFLFEVLPTGVANAVLQRITLCSKGWSRKWERQWHTDSWGPWICTYADRNDVLWSGEEVMDSVDFYITLSESISTQPTGVVFVFSPYDGKVTQEHNFRTFFISKYQVLTHGGVGHTFTLFRSNFAGVATKYLYVSDKKITGNAHNGESGNNNGIIFDNSKWCLRYVIGV